ncbi:MAG TPA: nucleoside hydrolase [Acidimicrobiales bacterium]
MVATAFLMAACGGGDDGSSASPSSSVTAAPLSSTVTTAPPTTVPETTPIVIDTDLAADDLVAILYLLSSPAVEIKAITVSGTGEAHCTPGVSIAAGLVELVGRSGIQVSCGRETPLQGSHVFPDDWRTRADGAYGLTLPDGDAPASTPAPKLLADLIAGSPTPMTVLTLGPLTNLAEALEGDPGLAAKLGAVYVMGGAVDADGNVGPESGMDNVGAEWNIYVDPHAAAVVFEAAETLVLVSLDATNKAPVTPDFVDLLAANAHTPAALAARDLVHLPQTPYLWDTLTALVLTEARVATNYATERLVVVEEEGRESGRLKRSDTGAAIQVALDPDMARATDLLLRTLDGVAPNEPLVTPTTVAPLASATIRYDGTTCSYDGPPNLPAGPITVTFEKPGDRVAIGALVRVKDGATFEELVAWVKAHPGTEQPPMVDAAEAIELRSTVTLAAGTWAAACLDGGRNLGVLAPLPIPVG